MYRVVDTYDGFCDVIGSFDSLDEAKDAARERCEETDGECQVSVLRRRNVGWEVIT